jgi:ATP-dependent DNA helicase RecG
MKESQQIEWKESWRDEYLRWICGFANAEGCFLDIGRAVERLIRHLKSVKVIARIGPAKGGHWEVLP